MGVHYCRLNFAGILAWQGLYLENHALPFTPGEKVTGLCRKRSVTKMNYTGKAEAHLRHHLKAKTTTAF